MNREALQKLKRQDLNKLCTKYGIKKNIKNIEKVRLILEAMDDEAEFKEKDKENKVQRVLSLDERRLEIIKKRAGHLIVDKTLGKSPSLPLTHGNAEIIRAETNSKVKETSIETISLKTEEPKQIKPRLVETSTQTTISFFHQENCETQTDEQEGLSKLITHFDDVSKAIDEEFNFPKSFTPLRVRKREEDEGESPSKIAKTLKSCNPVKSSNPLNPLLLPRLKRIASTKQP